MIPTANALALVVNMAYVWECIYSHSGDKTSVHTDPVTVSSTQTVAVLHIGIDQITSAFPAHGGTIGSITSDRTRLTGKSNLCR